VAVSYVLVAVATAQLGDLITFLKMVSVHGTSAEANPVVEHVAVDLGLPMVAAVKLAAIVLAVATYTVLAGSRRPVHRRMAAVVATVGTLAGLVGMATNVLAMS
jgi:hypothetical protein